MKKGFTLIELLVAVLIIGILAAIALPQYQRAVEKSRAAEALSNIRAISSAVERYRLATGNPTSTFEDLDIELPGDVLAVNKIQQKYYTFDIRNLNSGKPGGHEEVATRNNPSNNPALNFYIYRHFNDFITCRFMTVEANKTCSYITGKTATSDASGTWSL